KWRNPLHPKTIQGISPFRPPQADFSRDDNMGKDFFRYVILHRKNYITYKIQNNEHQKEKIIQFKYEIPNKYQIQNYKSGTKEMFGIWYLIFGIYFFYTFYLIRNTKYDSFLGQKKRISYNLAAFLVLMVWIFGAIDSELEKL
ncbi:hypothetical protein K9L63_03035, partial [Candidatus Gracilibacteria bacterium]|nr:hypothetical protein [Candidatus Gracilibacteria bacterium]